MDMNKERRAPPRAYCDICEEFDLHETEDCPHQASDDVPAGNTRHVVGSKRVPERPYCDICESK